MTDTTPSTPEDWEAYLKRAHALFDEEKYTEAIDECTQGLEHCPIDNIFGRVDLHSLRALCHFFLQQNEAALADSEKALELLRSDKSNGEPVREAFALAGRANIRYRLGQYSEAIEDYQQALELLIPYERPDYKIRRGYILQSLGDCYFKLKQYENARDSYSEALILIPPDNTAENKAQRRDILISLGDCHYRLDQYEKALPCLNQALKLTPRDNTAENKAKRRDILHILGNCYYQIDQYEKALAYYSEALELTLLDNTAENKTKRKNILFNLGDCYYWLDQYENALPYYNQALELIPLDTLDNTPESKIQRRDILSSLGACHFQLNQYKKALVYVNQALELTPPDNTAENQTQRRDILSSLGACHYRLDQYKEAHALYNQALELIPLDTLDNTPESKIQRRDILSSLGVCHFQLNQYKKVLHSLNQALALTPAENSQDKIEHSNTLLCRGYSYLALKQYKEALENFNQALKFLAQDALTQDNKNLIAQTETLIAIGECCRALEQYTEALENFNQASNSLPQDAPTQNNKNRIAQTEARIAQKKRHAEIGNDYGKAGIEVYEAAEALREQLIYEDTKPLAHYTGLDVGCVIAALSDDEKTPTIRLGDRLRMNDPQEGAIALECLIGLPEQGTRETIAYPMAERPVFFASFVHKDNDNSLDMWRLYGQNGKGCALLFDTELLSKLPLQPTTPQNKAASSDQGKTKEPAPVEKPSIGETIFPSNNNTFLYGQYRPLTVYQVLYANKEEDGAYTLKPPSEPSNAHWKEIEKAWQDLKVACNKFRLKPNKSEKPLYKAYMAEKEKFCKETNAETTVEPNESDYHLYETLQAFIKRNEKRRKEALTDILSGVRYLVKTAHYATEQEYRIIIDYLAWESQLIHIAKTDLQGQALTHPYAYLELALELTPEDPKVPKDIVPKVLRGIILGHCADPKHSLATPLRVAQKGNKDFTVEYSTIKFR